MQSVLAVLLYPSYISPVVSQNVPISPFTFVMCVINFSVLAIWMLVGISLPIFLQVKVTAPVYYKLSQIDFEKIMHQVDEEEEDE